LVAKLNERLGHGRKAPGPVRSHSPCPVLRWPAWNCGLEVVSIRLPSPPNVSSETKGGFVALGFAHGKVVTVTRQVPTSALAPSPPAALKFLAVATAGARLVAASRASPAATVPARRNERRLDFLFIVSSPWKGWKMAWATHRIGRGARP